VQVGVVCKLPKMSPMLGVDVVKAPTPSLLRRPRPGGSSGDELSPPKKARRRLSMKTVDREWDGGEEKVALVIDLTLETESFSSCAAPTGPCASMPVVAANPGQVDVLAGIRVQIAMQSKLLKASAALRPEANQGHLPCREEEQEQIIGHLSLAIRNGGSSKVLYVSGMPGTGKTASVLKAVRQLEDKAKDTKDYASGSDCQFAFAHVNAMCLAGPAAVFSEIVRQLTAAGELEGTGRQCSKSVAPAKLTQLFERRGKSDRVIVLLVDEMDYLATRDQAVLYRMFNWLTLPNPRLVIAAISNTMDLPERLLPRVSSRFGLVRVSFQPYNKEQINEILSQRLSSHDASSSFDPLTLKLCGARVAAGSGDIRKALQLCKRALEVRMARTGQTTCVVDLEDLKVAEKELLHANPSVSAIHGLGGKAHLFLAALMLEMRKRTAEAVPEKKVFKRYGKLLETLAKVEGDSNPMELSGSGPEAANDEAAFLAKRLEAMSLIEVQHVREHESDFASKGQALGLQSLDIDDLAGALLEAVKNATVLQMLRAC